MGAARYIVGDVFATLATLEDSSVDLVFSSPPFLALRSYLPADHPDKGKEIGSEATPADFLDTLLDVVEACDRVLAPHGSLCFELGDTFAGSGGAGGDYAEGGLREGQPLADGTGRRQRAADVAAGILAPQKRPGPGARDAMPGWPLAKSLCGIPTLFAWSLAYGRNLLRPERTTPRWRIRNVIVWCRPNPPVGALGDKFRPATSYLTVACKSDRRWFDLDAVREPTKHPEHNEKYAKPGGAYHRKMNEDRGDKGAGLFPNHPAGAPPLDYWEIPTQPYPGSHYATMPSQLIVKPVASMCPSKVCRTCGEPRRRITEPSTAYTEARGGRGDFSRHNRGDADLAEGNAAKANVSGFTAQFDTVGWTDCGHDDWRAGVTLDCFAGSGTTLAVATGHGRDAIGVDIDERNAELALERVGPLFLSVEQLGDTPPPAPPVDVETEAV